MQKFEYTITDEAGLHARPAGKLVQQAKRFSSRVTISANGKECDATRLMALMGMGVKRGTRVAVAVEGGDEETCAAALEAFFKENL